MQAGSGFRPKSQGESAETRVDEPQAPSVVDFVLCCPQCHQPIPFNEQASHQVICHECGSSVRVENYHPVTTLHEIRILGRFQLLECVGQGTFGAVWRARDMELGRIVALKIPHASLMSSEAYRERFQREARAAAALNHPGIVRLYEVPTIDNKPVLVSEFIDGVSLWDLIEVKPLTFPEAARLVADVADALDYAHSMGLVHRDIKPGNIMVKRVAGEQPLAECTAEVGNAGSSRARSATIVDPEAASTASSPHHLTSSPLNVIRPSSLPS
jgi:serine/threonine protein kinase